MAVSFGGLTRVSNSLQTLMLTARLRDAGMLSFQAQQRLASGRQLISISDDPIAAEKITRLNKTLEGQDQILRNLQYADLQLTSADTAIGEIHELLIEANRIASEQADSFRSPEERQAQSFIIDGIISQLASIGNREFQGQYLFGGREIQQSPFSTDGGRVAYRGDLGERSTLVDDLLAQTFNVTASDVFKLRGAVAGAHVTFDPVLSNDVRLADLDGAVGAGVRRGTISVTEGGGVGVTFSVDLTGVETVGDVIAKFNDASAAAGATLALSINGTGLRITSGGGNPITVAEANNGNMAADLGIKGSSASPLIGDGMNRRVTITTPLAELAAGGVALPSGVTITNGSLSAVVTFAGAGTVGDVLNALNGAGAGIRARINAAGDAIEIDNQTSGSSLVIGENGGTDAATLGIRTIDGSTVLSELNGGRGFHPVSGTDLRITDAAGVSFEVDLSAAVTVGDVINAINAAAAGAGATIVAQTSSTGGGIELAGGGGPGNVTVERANLSPAASELGLLGVGSPAGLVGENVIAFRQSGVFTALYQLRDSLVSSDSVGITLAGGLIEDAQKQVAAIQGQVGARSQSMVSRREQTENAVTATTVLLSEVQDVDLAEAITRFQQAQTALQATLLSGSQTMNLSLMDFLR